MPRADDKLERAERAHLRVLRAIEADTLAFETFARAAAPLRPNVRGVCVLRGDCDALDVTSKWKRAVRAWTGSKRARFVDSTQLPFHVTSWIVKTCMDEYALATTSILVFVYQCGDDADDEYAFCVPIAFDQHIVLADDLFQELGACSLSSSLESTLVMK